jgi:hypothetical protein
MRYIHEKGTIVNPIQQSARKSFRETGIRARLRGVLHAKGIGLWFAVVLVVLTGVLGFAPEAYATGNSVPVLVTANRFVNVFSTKAKIEEEVFPEGLETEVTTEYSTKSDKGPWIEQSKGQIAAADTSSGLVSYSARDLSPQTSYWVRFRAKNADGEVEEVIPFETLPIGPPEIEKEHSIKEISSAESTTFGVSSVSPTSAQSSAIIYDNGAETKYSFEYAPAEVDGSRPAEGSAAWKLFPSGATGTVTTAEESASVAAQVTGLSPETKYYGRLKASNSKGAIVETGARTEGGGSFITLTEAATVFRPRIRNVTSDSVYLIDSVFPRGSETHWRFEYAESMLGPWSTVPGGAGTLPQASVEGKPYNYVVGVGADLTGLMASKTYYVRLFAENANAIGEGKFCEFPEPRSGSASQGCEPISVSTADVLSLETAGLPVVKTFAVHGLVGESMQLDGGVNPEAKPTSAEQTINVEGAPTGGTFTLTFKGQTTVPIAYDAPVGGGEGEGSGSVTEALRALPALSFSAGVTSVSVEGVPGEYRVYFAQLNGTAPESEPQIEANGSGLTPSGSVTVTTDFKGGEAAETHYRFEYVSQASFVEHGWSEAQETPELSVAPSNSLEVVDAVLPVLPAGETYRYRLVAISSAPGAGVVEGAEQVLRVPSFTVEPAPVTCPNEAFRTGFSAHLPDCRAYEQISPVEKSGAQEPFQYDTELGSTFLVGENGESTVLEAITVDWGQGAGAGGSPYFFSREAGKGWGMTAGSPQPETNVENVEPQLYSGDLSQVAFEAAYHTSETYQSENIEYKVGPAGGPYTTVASVPVKVAIKNTEEGWIASDRNFSKLIFDTRDYDLSGEPSGTHSGLDLYEYTAQNGLRQLNVSGEPAGTIGSCGATLSNISSDGSHVFFEAGCSPDLYVRVDGSKTVDIGAYQLVRANSSGTILLLKNSAGELFEYDGETETVTKFTRPPKEVATEQAEEEEDTILGIPFETTVEVGEDSKPFSFSHQRYTYWGASPAENGDETQLYKMASDQQFYRYDAVEHLVECVSCASSFNPHPKLAAFASSDVGAEDLAFKKVGYQDKGSYKSNGLQGPPAEVSANGKFAFFTTPAALVPQDVDGEIGVENRGEPEKLDTGEYEDIGRTTSPSSDVYEWRAAGVDGCAVVDGCLSLITNGRGGFKNELLGTADEGRDVFIYSRSTLVSQVGRPEGSLGEGNFYDVRADGGFAPLPPRPTECEGDACSTPPGVPNDSTPSSLAFSGFGNVVSAPSGKTVVKSGKPKAKAKAKKPNAKNKKKARVRTGKKRGRKTARGHGSRRVRRSMGTSGGARG